MIKKIFITIFLILTACGCSENPMVAGKRASSISIESEMAQREITKYLAYEHFLTVDIKEKDLSPTYKKVLENCSNDKDNNCTVLDAKISTGNYPSAKINLRIKPQGVKNILEIASSAGKVVSESTHVEDLAVPILDNEKRQKMLSSHLERLIKLQDKAANDIESLIKISEELSKVNAELEASRGQNEHLLRRVNMDIVNIDFQVATSRSFWKPISQSLSEFSTRLSDGISDTIETLAYLIPWIIVIMAGIFSFRFLWRKGKKNKKIAQPAGQPDRGNAGGADA
jgi:hypothetical protein